MKALGAIFIFLLAFGAYQWIAPKALGIDEPDVSYETGSEIGNELCGQYGWDYHEAPNGFYTCQ